MPRSLRTSFVAISLFGFCAAAAFAQKPAPRFEIATQMTMLRLSDFRFNTPIGIGGRFSYDLTTWLIVEADVHHFPSDKIAWPEGMTSIGSLRQVYFRRRTDALVGLRIGTRGERLGAFVKARPGATRLTDRGATCLGPGCALILPSPVRPKYRTEFAFDIGGSVEAYPGQRVVLRADISDMIIRHDSTVIPCPSGVCTTHNLSTGVGVGFRF